MSGDDAGFAARREAELIAEASTWDITDLVDAEPDDLPTIDLGSYLADRADDELERVAAQVRSAGERTGFHLLVGHGIPATVFAGAFDAARSFLEGSDATKRSILIDDPRAATNGIGYLPPGERRLPRRARGNLNEAVIFKQDRDLRLADNPWPDPATAPGFRERVEQYAEAVERVALELVPVYARALDLPREFFAEAFRSPFSRLRLSRYRPTPQADADEFGIAPHVDTTFFTLLAQSAAGLVIFGERRARWLRVPFIPGALVVNTGELLKQWSNDRFLSVKHFVPPFTQGPDRYSIPFFFNATADFPMACLPTCHGPGNPPRYPTVSYLESQAAAQGE